MDVVRLHAYVSGRVQGVFFRKHTAREVLRLDPATTGFVRNLSDGRVEVVAQASEAVIKELSAWLRRGSPQSRVDAVDETFDEPVDGSLQRFRVAKDEL